MTTSEIVFDKDRSSRLGFDEAVFGASKSPDQLESIIQDAQADRRRLLITRLDKTQFEALSDNCQHALSYEPKSRTAVLGEPPTMDSIPRVAVVTAGTSDVPVALEVSHTLRYYGEPCTEIFDVGVAGLWRLLDRLEDIKQHDIVVAVAGMEAAIVSVLGGLYPGLMIAVPTSIGYGVSHNGAAALTGALASCAPGVVVVNIDNGYGAACAALRALRAVRAKSSSDD
ncbi:MAG: nickel pincer cofactor biosynthesis protein LarB [Gammaproteobacteria bacterium]|nr:nickel pincer cofactor biosynthesis protein LarB [Gammaproteobacteria bacterium]